MKISVIVPTLNEGKVIGKTLEHLFHSHEPEEVIVVDGGSTDDTVSLAREWAPVVPSKKGRAVQLNEGARQATGDIFLFLHADTQLPQAGLDQIKNAIRNGKFAGRFRMRFDERDWLLRLFESYTRFQCFSYGDQGFFVERKLFEKLGGFREDVPFEDIDFYKRLQTMTKPVILKERVVTSARRFRQMGSTRQKFINLFLVAFYYMGLNVQPFKEKLYPDIR